MPRRKRVEEPILNGDAILMLPPVRTVSKHEHREDPYESPAGAVPQVIRVEPLRRKLTEAEKQQQVATRKEHKMLATRHARYLDALIEFKGDREQALGDVFGLTPDEVRPQLLDLLAEVRRGLAVSPLGTLLEQQGLDLQGRVNVLARHAYSDNPAASLKSIDMINELAGQGANEGSFEAYLRLAKLSKG